MRLHRVTASPSLRNLAFDLGLLRGHEEYTRFIILGRSRSGSNLLRGLLNAHPNVQAFGEIFQNKEAIGWGFSEYRRTQYLYDMFRSDPAALLRTQVFGKQPKDISAVGFKIFYYHAQDPQWQSVWDFLLTDKDLHVIHIKRANILKTHLSRKRAIQTDRWVNVSGESEEIQAIALDYEECLADFVQTEAWHEEFNALFADHPTCDVEYELLAADIGGEISRVQDFLGVERFAVLPETHRQITESMSSSIANYAELRSQFAGTRWEGFFQE